MLLIQENVVLGIVPRYFDKHYKLAVSIYSCGTALGIIVMPLVTQIFLDIYGLSGALLLIAGIGLHSLPCGALLDTNAAYQSIETEYHPLVSKDRAVVSLKEKSSTLWESINKSFGTQLFLNAPFIVRVLIPGIVYGYVFAGWLIYIVSLATVKELSLKDSSTVASFGGIGVLAIRMVLPLVHDVMTCKQLLYASSLIMASSLISTIMIPNFLGLSISSVWFGIGIGILGAEVYIAAKDVAEESEYINVIAWFHLFFGFASLLSGSITGKYYTNY